MSALPQPSRAPATGAQTQARLGRAPLRRVERTIAVCGLVALALFYGGPFIVQTTRSRRPPNAIVSTTALSRLPTGLSPGGRYDVKSVSVTYQRNHSASWQEILTASGEWQARAVIVLRQKADLFRADSFALNAHAAEDDGAEFTSAQQQAARLSSKDGLPSIPGGQLLFVRQSAAGDEFSTKVEFTVQRNNYGWHGPSPAACMTCWVELLSEGGAWQMGYGPPVELGPSVAKIQQLKTRAELPQGALIAGEPAAAKAISDYLEKRRDFIAAVRQKSVEENATRFDHEVRRRLSDEVSRKLSPTSAYSAQTMAIHRPESSITSRPTFDCIVDVDVVATVDIFAETTFSAEAANLGDNAAAFTEAQEYAKKFLPDLTDSVKPVRLFRRAVEKGTTKKIAAKLGIKTDGAFWDITEVTLPDVFPADALTAVTATQLKASDLIVDSSSVEMRDCVSRLVADRKKFVDEVQRELVELEKKWGSDRAAWQSLHDSEEASRNRIVATIEKAIGAVGGREAINRFSSYKASYISKGNKKGAAGFTAKVVVYIELPDKIRIDQEVYSQPKEVKIPGVLVATMAVNPGTPSRATICLAGGMAWQLAETMAGPLQQPLPAETQELLRDMLHYANCEALVPLFGAEYTLEIIGESDSTPTGSIGIKILKAGRRDLTLFFDEKSGLPIGDEHAGFDEAGHFFRATERFSEYRNFSGLMMPTIVREVRTDDTIATTNLQSFEPLSHAADVFRVPIQRR